MLSDQFVLATGRGASGNVFVDFPAFDEPLTIAWTVPVVEDGVYGLEFVYALSQAKADRPLLLTVDGAVIDSLDFCRKRATVRKRSGRRNGSSWSLRLARM